MGNSKEDPPANASTSSAGQEDEQNRVTSIIPATSVIPDRPTYQYYTPVPPIGSIVPRALRHPYDWRPQNHSPRFFYGTPLPYAMYPHGVIYAQPLMAHYHLPPFFFGTPPPYAMYPHGVIYAQPLMAHDAVPDIIPDIWDGESKTSEDTEIPEGSLASGIELRTERGYSGNEASCEGSDTDYQCGSPPKASDDQSSADGTPQKGNPTRMNEPSQPVLGYPMTTGAVPVLPVPGGVTRCTDNLSPILPTCSEITSTAVPTTSVSVPSETWMQAMQELKRQLKLGASREAVLLVKLRKQVAELDRLTRLADLLTMENAFLRAQIRRLQEENVLALNASLKVSLEEIPRESEDDQHQNPESDEKKADDQQQNLDSNEKSADDQQQNPESNEKRVDDQQQNPDSNEKRVDDKHQNPESDEKRADDQQKNPDSNEKRTDDQQQNPESDEKRADDQQQNPDSNEKRADDEQQNPDSNEK